MFRQFTSSFAKRRQHTKWRASSAALLSSAAVASAALLYTHSRNKDHGLSPVRRAFADTVTHKTPGAAAAHEPLSTLISRSFSSSSGGDDHSRSRSSSPPSTSSPPVPHHHDHRHARVGPDDMVVHGKLAHSTADMEAQQPEQVHPIGRAVPMNFKAGDKIDGLTEYSRAELSRHKTADDGIWVSFRNGVYDVTEFIEAHPGGAQRILLAKGGAIDPFWDLYSIHKSQHVFQTIEQFRIGNLKIEPGAPPLLAVDDPYSDEPARHPALRVRSERPFNAETPLELVGDNFLVPSELFYVRNHMPTPLLDVNAYELQVAFSPDTPIPNAEDEDGKKPKHPAGVRTPIHLSVADLKRKFKAATVTTTMLCGGNRRSELSQVTKCPGLPWGAGAISTATWTGVRLRDLLRYCGVDTPDDEGKHVCFEGLDDPNPESSFGSSVELSYALDRSNDVLLAWEMNGEPLSRDHGAPLRVVIPGVIGARNVKWLRRIYLSPKESPSLWQRGPAYRVFPGTIHDPAHAPDGVDEGQAVYDPPVLSVITSPGGDSPQDADGPVTLKGYAFSGGGRSINYVEFSMDNGKTWNPTKLLPKPDFVEECRGKCWSWSLWQARIDAESIPAEARKSGKLELAVRARDSGNNLQPETAAQSWNYRGLLCNSWSRVSLPLVSYAEEDDGEEEE